ncbi:hypothetical protein [Rhizobium sullae]|uniref:hypothetical protein n=1 Tax=Rhizobium sullae TaxID=50338 RepID=UPI000B35D204|nr:hypothetical protein [Rhizobium sullae]
MVQAKLGGAKNLKIAIDHETNSNGKAKPELTDDASKIFAAAARSRAARAFVLSPSLREAVNIANRGFEPGDTRYQLETILRTDLRGRVLTRTNRDWCFYAGWFPKHLPRAVDVRTLAATTIANGDKDRPRQYSLEANPVAFTDLFHQTIFAAESPYGLILSEKLVGEVVDGVLETAPDIRLLLASADGRLGYKLGSTKELLVSGSLIPEQLIYPTVAPDVSDEFDPVAQPETNTTPGGPADHSTTKTLGR